MMMVILSTTKKFTNKTFARALFALAACTALRFLFPSYDDYYDDDDRDVFSRRQLAQQQASDVQTDNSNGGKTMPYEEVVVVQEVRNDVFALLVHNQFVI